MIIPLLSALPDLKKRNQEVMFSHAVEGYNQALDELAKYSFSEEELKKINFKEIPVTWTLAKPCSGLDKNDGEVISVTLSHEAIQLILSSLPLWLRKDVK